MVRIVILRLLESYFRHRWLNILPIVLLLAAGGAYVSYEKPKYAARGTIYVQKQPLVSALSNVQTDFSWQSPAQVTVGELQDLMQTQAFVRSIVAKTPLEQNVGGNPESLDAAIAMFHKAVTVNPVGDNLIEVYGQFDDPVAVQQLVGATMDMFVQWKLNNETQDSLVAEKFFNETIQPYKVDLDKARNEMQAYLEAHPEPVRGARPPQETLQINQLQVAIDQATTRLNDTVTKAEDARLARSRAESNIRQMYLTIDAPAQPVAPETGLKDKAMSVAIFGIIGVVLSGLCIAGGALLDRSFRFALDVRHGLDLPVLAQVPRTRAEHPLLAEVQAARVAEQQPVEEPHEPEAATEIATEIATDATLEQVMDVEPEEERHKTEAADEIADEIDPEAATNVESEEEQPTASSSDLTEEEDEEAERAEDEHATLVEAI